MASIVWKATIVSGLLLGQSLLASLLAGAECETCQIENGHCRAGNPQCLLRWASPSNTPCYTGCYVGGGAPCHKGEARCLHEGVWGWDYTGHLYQRKVWLSWYHGEKYQGGTGKYNPDSPHYIFHKE